MEDQGWLKGNTRPNVHKQLNLLFDLKHMPNGRSGLRQKKYEMTIGLNVRKAL